METSSGDGEGKWEEGREESEFKRAKYGHKYTICPSPSHSPSPSPSVLLPLHYDAALGDVNLAICPTLTICVMLPLPPNINTTHR